MDHHFDKKDQEVSIHLSGRLTFNDHARMRALISEAVKTCQKEIAIDLSELEFIDSAGIGMILIAREEFDYRQKKLTIKNATGQVMRVMTITNLSKLVAIDG